MGGKARSSCRGWKLAATILAALLPTGCKTCDLVEAELRYQTNRVDTLENELLLKNAEIATLEGTVAELRAHVEKESNAPGGADGPTTETSYKRHGMARLSLGSLTGGRDLDNDGRTDALEVVLQPHDYDDDVFKCPGMATIALFQVEKTGLKRPIGNWEADETMLRDGWRATLLGQGYQLVLPWQEHPANGTLRVVVRFTTEGGRQFEAERDFTLSAKPSAAAASTDEASHCLAPGPRTDDPPPVPAWRVEAARLGLPVPVENTPTGSGDEQSVDETQGLDGDHAARAVPLAPQSGEGSQSAIPSLIALDNETLEPVSAWSPAEEPVSRTENMPNVPDPALKPAANTRRRTRPGVSSFGSPPAPLLFHDFRPARARGGDLEEILASPPITEGRGN